MNERKTRLIGKLDWTCWLFSKSVYYDTCQNLCVRRFWLVFVSRRPISFVCRSVALAPPNCAYILKIIDKDKSPTRQSGRCRELHIIRVDQLKMKYDENAHQNRIYWSRDKSHVHHSVSGFFLCQIFICHYIHPIQLFFFLFICDQYNSNAL